MNTHLRTLAAFVILHSAFGISPTATAQTMPQDNWRFDTTQFSSPVNTNQLRSIAIGSGGVYVGEIFSGSTPNRVLRFTEAGAFVSRFADTFGYILGLACDPAGNVYLLDRTDSRVKMYDSTGAFIRQWGGAGSGDGQFSLATATGNTMIAVSKTSEIYVCDPGNTRVQVFDSNGNFVRKWGQLGSLPGQFAAGQPMGIAISADGGKIAMPTPTSIPDTDGFKVFNPSGQYLIGITAALGSHQPIAYTLAISKDNILALPVRFVSYALLAQINFYDLSSGSAIRIHPITSIDGIAFSDTGNLYAISGNRFSIGYREYTNASNFLAPPAIPHPLVLSAAQRTGTNLVDVDYQVTDADSATVTTALLAVRSGDDNMRIGNSMAMRTFVEGTATNIGANQPTGVTRHVTWNMPADWAVDYATIRIEALAKDSRNLLGIHWITVPASGGDPAFQISSAPVTDTLLRDLWLWFMASGQGVSTSYVNNATNGWLGTVRGTSGVFTGVALAEDYIVNSSNTWNRTLIPGRLYAFEQMGARPISASEKVRALAGKFAIASVDDNSIVKATAPATSYLKGWGDNSAGQANWFSVAAPNISKVAAGGNTTLFLTSDGTLWGMGNNANGQLGDGTTTSRSLPIKIATGVSKCAVGIAHSLFVKTDGTLWAMGANSYGQLGDGTTTNRITPVQVATNVSSAAVGVGGDSSGVHSLFIKTDGTLWSMGYNTQGQLGDGTTTHRSTPVQVASSVAQCAAGPYHSLFVKADGTLWAMGSNSQGALGDGTTTQRLSPVQIATGVSQAVGGGNFNLSYPGGGLGAGNYSLFIKSDGTLWAMGYNAQGALGDGTITQRNSPVQVATGVVQATAGYGHSVFRKTDNTVWTMGYNAQGQLGDGTTTNRSTPIQLDTNALGIAAGAYHTVTFTIP